MTGRIATTITVMAVLIFGRMTMSEDRSGSVKTRPNVVLITIDTLRADHLGCYGDKNIQTPAIDSLARDGVVFNRAISQVPLTWPSHAAILTGTYPFQNGVQDFTGHPLAPDFRNLAQAFQSAGYATGAVVSSFVLDRSWGLARGFDFYDDTFSPGAFQGRDLGLVERPASESVSRALSWLEKTSARRFFLWLHLYDPHSPYAPPEPYRTEYKDRLYDGEIAYADHELGRLLTWLKQRHVYDNSVIVLLSDHGESLGEHGESEHGFFLYNSTTHIPLIVKPPVQSRIRKDHIEQPVETVSVVPTVLHLAGLHDRLEKQAQARDLFAPDASNQAAYSETFYPFSSFGWSPLHSIESEKYHYIEAPEPELYDVKADPAEQNNVASSQPATLAVLKQDLQNRISSRPFSAGHDSGNLSPDASEKLRALGYAAYRSPLPVEALKEGLADPKDKLWEFNSILQAQDTFRAAQFDKGRQILEEVAKKDPQMYVVPFLLGEAALRQERWSDASAALKRSLELNPDFDEAMTALAHSLHAQGNDQEAKTWLEKAVAVNSENYRAWYELGTLEARSDPQNALAAYRKSVSIQPSFARGQRDLGILEVGQKQYSSASEHLQKALALGLDDAHLRNFLGIAYAQTNRLDESVENLKEAIRQDPNLAEAHLNLGFAYQKLHEGKAAKDEYDAACRLQPRFCELIAPPK